MRRWLWVTLPEIYAARPLRVGDVFTWTCHGDTSAGDIAVLYRADLLKDFSHVFRVDELDDSPGLPAYEDVPTCQCTLVAVLRPPIPLAEARRDAVLSRWPALLVEFHGTAFPIEPAEWRALLGLSSPLDRPRLRSIGGR